MILKCGMILLQEERYKNIFLANPRGKSKRLIVVHISGDRVLWMVVNIILSKRKKKKRKKKRLS